MNIVRAIIVLFVLGTPFGCSTRLADLTIVSTKNVYPKGIDVSALPKKQGVEAKDVGFLGIGASLSDAIDKVLERGQGNLMIDCVVYFWEAPLFYGWKVRGTVVDVPYYQKGDQRNQAQIPRDTRIKEPSPGVLGEASRADESLWSRLRRGLDQNDVRALLGEPTEQSDSTKSTIWFYPDINGGYVLFKSDRVHSWRAP